MSVQTTEHETSAQTFGPIRIGQVGNNGTMFDNGLYINGEINSKSVRFLVDSGSTATLLSKKAFDRLDIKLLENMKLNIKSVNGSNIRVFGRIEFEIKFGKVNVKHPITVCDIDVDGIIGQDFILQHVRCWDMDTLKLKLRTGECIECFTSGEAERICRVTVRERVELPPKSFKFVKVSIPGGECLAESGYVENDIDAESSKLVNIIEGIVDPRDDDVGVSILNTGDVPLILHPRTHLGKCKSSYEESEDKGHCCANVTATNETVSNQEQVQYLPEHLQELLVRSSANLDPKETTEREVNTETNITKEDPKESTQREVTNKENKRMYVKVHEETPPSENVENQVTKDKPKETTNEPAAHINTENMAYREKAVDLLKTGAMPMVPPGRREWKEGAAFHIHLHGCDFTWPPQDWEKMSSDRRLMAWEHTAFQIEYLRQGSLSPTLSRSFLLDKYNFLALPGSGKVKRENSEKGSAKSRFYLYQVLKEVANSKEPSEAEKSQIDSLLMIRKDDELNRQLRSLEIPLRLFQ